MIKKIIFILPYPFKSIGYLPVATGILRNNGFESEIWDISPLLNITYDDQKLNRNEINFDSVKIFNQKRKLIQAILNLDEHCLVNCFIKLCTDSFFIYRALSKRGIKYCGLQMTGLPNPINQEKMSPTSINNFFGRIFSLNFTDISNHFFNKILFKYYFFFGIKAADIILLGGEKSLENKIYPIDNNTRLLWAHSFDYDFYIQIKNQIALSDTSPCVFLDEYLPFHPDLQDIGIGSPVSSDEYYPKLCKFFDYIEHEFHVRIIIAAHPKSNYEETSDFFQGRTVIKGDTARLVKDSSFVIAHMSTSINFAVLFKKPILFATMDKLQKLKTGKFIPGLYIEKMASELMTTPINIDHFHDLNQDKIIHVNNVAYNTYKTNYIKKDGTPELPFWEIFSLYCQRLN